MSNHIIFLYCICL